MPFVTPIIVGAMLTAGVTPVAMFQLGIIPSVITACLFVLFRVLYGNVSGSEVAEDVIDDVPAVARTDI